MKYFELTKTGRSVWWSWILGTWIALLIWVAGQTFLIDIMRRISDQLDPELANQFAAAELSMIAEEDFLAFGGLIGLSLLLGIAAIIGTLVTLILSYQNSLKSDVIAQFGSDNSRSEDKITTVFAILTVIAIVIAVILYVVANQYVDTTEFLSLIHI